ncbi:hypothetical protein CsSME_00044402 [Camellia sinensis var. sinensis]
MEIDSKSGENPLLNESEEVEEPKRGMCFSSKQEVYTFYAKYAKHVGFSIAHKTQVFGDDGELRYFGIECSRSGKRTKKSEVNPLKPSLSTKIGCKARVRASLQKDGRFMLTTVNLEHNHDLIPTDSRYFAMNKKILTPVKRKLEVNDQVGIGVSRNYHSMVVEAGGYESLTFDERDARNYIDRTRRLRLKEGDSDALQKYFMRMQAQNSSFYSMIDVDTDFCIRNLFWVDAISRAAYKEFGDVVSFDTTYLTNKYDMPFVSFVGVNHHGQSILLGCGLLCSEDTDTFIWLFKSLLNCMSDHPPKAIITDQCKAMQNAIEIVFPNTRHRWCLWHIMKKILEKLKGYSQYESIKLALQNAVYDTITKDEFETKWKEMIAEFNLYENEWLGVLYDERHRWVPVYVKDIFWAGISTTQRSESMNAFFDGYVNPKTTLKQFVEQYDNALRSKVEKEKKADFKSRHKVFDCLTVYGFEKQFQDAYTNAKFKEVQAEMNRLVYCQPFLVKDEDSICTYFVKEAMVVFGKMKHVDFVVYYNSTEFDVQCMCRLFQFRGIMCAHSLVVLIARCINEVPNKYILPRWRKDLDRGYTCIKTTYTGFGDDFNAKVYDKMNRKFIGIVQVAGNSEGKIKIIDRGLDEIKERVMKDDEGGGSNVAPATSNVPPITSNAPSSPIDSINKKAISTTKMKSP